MSLTNTAIKNAKLISEITPEDACYIGGYYGKTIKKNINRRTFAPRPSKNNLLISQRSARYKIISLCRNGDLKFIDRKSKKEYIMSPLFIVNEKSILNNFSSTNSCYIGILAGMSIENKRKPSSANIKTPILKLVKT